MDRTRESMITRDRRASDASAVETVLAAFVLLLILIVCLGM